VSETKSANDIQVAGDHYKTSTGKQHWDFVEDNGIGYLEGCATKYVTRWRKKNGLQDLNKAEHFTVKVRELFLTNGRGPRGKAPIQEIFEFAQANSLGPEEQTFVMLLTRWEHVEDLDMALSCIDKLRKEAESGSSAAAV
jgi:hypothetical protein